MRTGSKKLASESLGIIVSDAPLISTTLILGLVNPGGGRNSTIYWMLILNIYSLPENTGPVLQGITK